MNSARDLILRLRRRGVAIASHGDHLQFEAPAGSVSGAEKTELRALKSKILTILHEQKRTLGLTVAEYKRSGLTIEIRVGGVEHSLWVVPEDGDRICLLRRRVPAGRIWTIGELEFLARSTPTVAVDFQRLARLRSSFNATVVELGPDSDEDIQLA